jgi:plasmid replication initiation protein
MDNGILKLLDDVFFNTDEVKDNNNVEKLDLSKDEDYAKFNKYVDECKKICDSDDSTSNLAKLMFEQFFGFDMNDIVDDIKKAGDEIHEQAVKERVKDKMNEETNLPDLPSNSTPLDRQIHLHNIVGEYVDTYIRPYGKMDTKSADDIYADLFEFACWIMNR